MVHLEEKGPITILRMDEGPGNFVNLSLVDTLSQRLDEVLQSKANVVVLTGNSSTFIDGGDLVAIVEGGPPYIEVFITRFAALLKRIFTLPLPIIAAVNGSAMTSGYTVAAACDLRVMTMNSKARIAVQALQFRVPLEPVPLEMVRYVLPAHYVQYIMYTAREFSPSEALQMGLVDELAPPNKVVDRALELADFLGKVPNESFVQTKQQLRQAALEQLNRYEAEWGSRVISIWSASETLAFWGAIVEQIKQGSKNK